MKKENAGCAWKDFCKGFFVTLAILAPFYAAAYFMLLPGGTAAKEHALPQAAPQQGEPAQPIQIITKSYNLLLAVKDDNGGLIQLSLARFDTSDGRVKVAAVPTGTVLLSRKAPQTASVIFEKLGFSALRDAFSETLGVPVSGAVCLGCRELQALVDKLGGFTFTADRTVEVINDESGLVEYRLEKGTAKLSGNDAANLLKSGAYENEQAVRLSERLWECGVLECTGDGLSGRLTSFYKENVNRLESDVDSAGVYTLAKAAAAASVSHSVQCVPLRGAFAESKYELAEDSASSLQAVFGSL